MKRGDVVVVALQGEQGKPRPALVVQDDRFADLGSVAVLPITTTLLAATLLRVEVEATTQNGLKTRSQIMVDKPQTPHRSKVAGTVGTLEAATMLEVNRSLSLLLGLG